MSVERPDIVLFFTDQQRADTIGALGNPRIRTPNLDRLCREGTAFERAFTPSPVCVPARASLIFGQYPAHTKCYDNPFAYPKHEERQSFMQALSDAGYETHGIGKCHFHPDLQAMYGFQKRERQEELVKRIEDDDYLLHLRERGLGYLQDPHGVRSEMYYVPQPAQMSAEAHPTQWVGDRAVSFVESHARAKRPFYLYVGFVHPHPPFAPPVPWHKLYRATDMPLPLMPDSLDELLMYVNRHQNRYKYRDRGLDINLIRCIRAYYYACISFIDFQVGRVLDALARAGRLDRTIVAFSADHGEHLGDYGCFGKRSMHNTAARVPMIVRAPGRLPAGARVARAANLVDLAPTLLAAAGAQMKTHDPGGVDLARLATGDVRRDAVFSQYQKAGRAVYMAADDRWKYIYSAPDGKEWLFDHEKDPLETRNFAGESSAREPRDRLKKRLLAHLIDAGETEALDGGDWHAYPKLTVPEDPDAGLIRQDHAWADPRIPGYTDSQGT